MTDAADGRTVIYKYGELEERRAKTTASLPSVPSGPEASRGFGGEETKRG